MRVWLLDRSLPAAAAEFLSDPSLVVLGCGWDGADERKMLETFGMGRARFKRFVDLQVGTATQGAARAMFYTVDAVY